MVEGLRKNELRNVGKEKTTGVMIIDGGGT